MEDKLKVAVLGTGQMGSGIVRLLMRKQGVKNGCRIRQGDQGAACGELYCRKNNGEEKSSSRMINH
jgi:3-hydroxyacyl-CoA dehydrogenase